MKFAATNKAPNGTEFGKIDHLSLFVAQDVLATLHGLRSGLSVQSIAILAFLSLGIDSQYLVCMLYYNVCKCMNGCICVCMT